MSDGFLARWSRRKRDEARQPAEAAPDATPVGPAEETPDLDESVLSSEELAQLPSLDALTAATDLTPFLRAGVPRALRNAALRRMWSVDPAIRDFVSEAREYAYDWNTPGGVPGTGGVISADEVRAVVERVFGGGEEAKAPDVTNDDGVSTGSPPLPCRRGVGGEGGALQDQALSVELPAPRPELYGGSVTPSRDLRSPLPPSHTLQRYRASPASLGEGIPRLSPDCAEPAAQPDSSPSSPPRLRRHGGAIPI